MGTYVVNSKKEQQELLTRCGLNSFVDLYKDIPEEVLLKDGLNLPKGLAELEVKRKFEDLADKIKFINIYSLELVRIIITFHQW